MNAPPPPGSVVRVSGPLVEIEGLDDAVVGAVVTLAGGTALGEVVALDRGVATAQMYEYTGGLGPGVDAATTGEQLSIPLGPGLLGGIFDGLLRPLPLGPDFLDRGWGTASLGRPRTWDVEVAVAPGDVVGPGSLLGTVAETAALEHRVLVPPDVRGEVRQVATDRVLAVDDVVAVVGDRPVRLAQRWPIRRARPARRRLPGDVPFVTGQRVLDLLFPIARGSTAGVPGGFGTGKTMLLQQVAKWCDADVIVYVGCGERGNEMADLLEDFPRLEDPRTGRSLMERTVVIVNSSDMPVMAREASIHTGVTIAEFYRDMGHDTVVIADSTSRWAQALREFATRTGELPAEEGYPARLASALADFYERAGRVVTLGDREASTTIVGAVSPPGGDETEPVTSHTQRFVRGFWSLDQELAGARHYPAVSWRNSFSRDVEILAAWHVAQDDPQWPVDRARLMRLLAEEDRLQPMVQLVGRQALPDRERSVLVAARLVREAILQQNALADNDAHSSPAKNHALVRAVLDVHDRIRSLVDEGVPASIIEEVDLGPLARAREDARPDDTEVVARARDRVLARLEEQR